MSSRLESANHYPNDEIDLFELMESIWEQKWTVAIITVLAVVAGAVYAFSGTPVYKATAQIQQPLAHSAAPLKALYGLNDLTSSQLTNMYFRTLNSNEYKRYFIDNLSDTVNDYLPTDTSSNHLITRLNSMIELQIPDTEKTSAIESGSITLAASPAATADAMLTEYVNTANQYLVDVLRKNFNQLRQEEQARIHREITALETAEVQKRQSRIKRLEEQHALEIIKLQDQLKAQKELYDARLRDRIINLQEALTIAKALNFDEPVSLSQLNNQVRGQVVISADIRSLSDPLYLRGTRLLQAELTELKNRPTDHYPDSQVRELEAMLAAQSNNREAEILAARSNDGDFSEEIIDLKSQLIELESQQFPDSLALNFISGNVVTDQTPTTPSKNLILSLSAILGFMAGIFVALIMGAIRKRRAACNAS